MQIWRLLPVDLESHHWAASSHRGTAVVRAESESNARKMTARAFGRATRVVPGKEVNIIPWDHPHLVSAELFEDSPFNIEGEEEILDPA